MSGDAKVHEVAAHLGLHPETVRKLARSNAFPGAYKSGMGSRNSPIRIPWAAVEDFRKKQPRAFQ